MVNDRAIQRGTIDWRQKIQAGVIGAVTGAVIGAGGSFLHAGGRMPKQGPHAAAFMVSPRSVNFALAVILMQRLYSTQGFVLGVGAMLR